MASERPDLPIDKLRAAAGDAAARERIDALHRELSSAQPGSAAIKEHVAELRKHGSLADVITSWFEDPRTQAFIDELTAAGL